MSENTESSANNSEPIDFEQKRLDIHARKGEETLQDDVPNETLAQKAARLKQDALERGDKATANMWDEIATKEITKGITNNE